MDEKNTFEQQVKLPYGYRQLSNGEIVDLLFDKQIPSPSGNPQWTSAAIDNALKNGKNVLLIIPLSEFSEVQFAVNANIEAILIQHNGSLEAQYKVESIQIMEY